MGSGARSARLLGALADPRIDATRGRVGRAPTGGLADEIDQLATAEFAKDRVGSLTFGTITPSSWLRAKSYGLADSAAGRAATPDTVYRIGSITKQFWACGGAWRLRSVPRQR